MNFSNIILQREVAVKLSLYYDNESTQEKVLKISFMNMIEVFKEDMNKFVNKLCVLHIYRVEI